jgi:GNAT superfamily N-acetyltransferase
MSALRIRGARLEDEPFLFALYASTRQSEFDAAGWPAEVRQAFLEMQYRARARAYAERFGDARGEIVELAGEPIGAVLVHRDAEEVRVVDVALLPSSRNQGIGSVLMMKVLDEAHQQRRPVRLNVLTSSPARRFYERLGFVCQREDAVYTEMEWHAERQPATSVPAGATST